MAAGPFFSSPHRSAMRAIFLMSAGFAILRLYLLLLACSSCEQANEKKGHAALEQFLSLPQ